MAMQAIRTHFHPVAPPQPVEFLLNEIDGLPAEQTLIDAGEFAIIQARAPQIPRLLEEIGRLREISFRDAGEGTGKSVDLDQFDDTYIHLFAWNRARKELVGAYRFAVTDEIVNEYGLPGLYTHSLFEYSQTLLDRLGAAVELGRSFVRPEYQRGFQPLLLLWKGISRFISRNPRYRVLFGPVSISNEYSALSRQLIVDFLEARTYLPELASVLKPRNPFRRIPPADWSAELGAWALAQTVKDLGSLISGIEPDKKGIPVLLKHYLRLGGKVIGFNVDHEFSDVLDGLIVVDLLNTEKQMLVRLMGEQAAREFLLRHQQPCAAGV